MRHQITFRQYRAMDLFFLTALACLSEALITLGATRWFPGEPYFLSLTGALAAIAAARWGWPCCLPALAGAGVFCLVSGATPVQFLVYCGGSLAALGLLPLLKMLGGWQGLKDSALRAVGYGLAAAIMMQLGRGAIALALGHGPMAALRFITTDALSAVFSGLILWIARRLEGLLEEQVHYLRRIEKQREEEAARGGTL